MYRYKIRISRQGVGLRLGAEVVTLSIDVAGSRNPRILHPHCQAQLTFPGPIRSGSPTHIKHLSSMILLIYINSFRPILAW